MANGGSDSKGSERGLEYDTLSGKYAEFIEAEVLPRVEKETGVTLTKDPEGRCTMGGSSGGLAAFTMAWYHPEWYHRVLIYSGTFVNTQSPAKSRDAARRLGISRKHHRQERQKADPHLDGGRRE